MLLGEQAKSLDMFTAGEIKGVETAETESRPNSGSRTNSPQFLHDTPTKNVRHAIRSAASEFRDDTRRFYRFVKKHIRLSRDRPTHVKSIHLVQEEDTTIWAKRSVSASSRCSVETSSSTDSSTKGDGLEIVCDLEEELNLES
ncbi:hypothetical protein ScPMuIL_016632 [Solemya velum]